MAKNIKGEKVKNGGIVPHIFDKGEIVRLSEDEILLDLSDKDRYPLMPILYEKEASDMEILKRNIQNLSNKIIPFAVTRHRHPKLSKFFFTLWIQKTV